MIQRVYERAIQSQQVTDWVIATPDDEIRKTAEQWGARVCMTSPDHSSGTDRCAEALRSQQQDYDTVINVQGDEPLIRPEQIDSLVLAMAGGTQVATLYRAAPDDTSALDPNTVKLVTDREDTALYFSRLPIPYERDQSIDRAHLLHVGMYAYASDTLLEIAQLPSTELEHREGLEQLRWLYHGVKIKCIFTEYKNYGVDTPEDLEQIKKLFNQND